MKDFVIVILKKFSFFILISFYFNLPLSFAGTEDNSTHILSEQLWQTGQDLYEKGQYKAALEKFKESFHLEPDPDKGSYIAWLISEVHDKENSNLISYNKCYLISIDSNKKILHLFNNWQLEVTSTGDIKIFKRSFSSYPHIHIFNDTFNCNNSYCLQKFFNRFCQKIAKNFYIIKNKKETIKNINVYTLEVINKKNNNIYSKIFLFTDHKKLYYATISGIKGAISKNAWQLMYQIISDINKQYQQHDTCKNINVAPLQIQKIKRIINDLFQHN